MGFSMESTTEWKMGAGAHTSAPQPWDWGIIVCLFGLILYVQSTIFQLYRDGSSLVEQVS